MQMESSYSLKMIVQIAQLATTVRSKQLVRPKSRATPINALLVSFA